MTDAPDGTLVPTTDTLPQNMTQLQAARVRGTATIMLPTMEELQILKTLAQVAAASGFAKNGSSPMSDAQTMFVMLKGWTLGIDPIESLSQIFIVDGKPSCSVQVMLALANRSGLLSRIAIPDTATVREQRSATVIVVRKDRPDDEYRGTFTYQEAEQAGLAGKTNWKNYWPQMLINRAVSIVMRRAIPEALSGMYLVEELAPATPVDPETGRPAGPVIVQENSAWYENDRLVEHAIASARKTLKLPDSADAAAVTERVLAVTGKAGWDEFKSLAAMHTELEAALRQLDAAKQEAIKALDEISKAGPDVVKEQAAPAHWSQNAANMKTFYERVSAMTGLPNNPALAGKALGLVEQSDWAAYASGKDALTALETAWAALQPKAQPKSASVKSTSAPAFTWDDAARTEIDNWLYAQFDRPLEVVEAETGVEIETYSSVEAARHGYTALALREGWPLIISEAHYTGKYVTLKGAVGVRAYGRSTTFRKAVGEAWYSANRVEAWVEGSTYPLDPPLVVTCKQAGKAGAEYWQAEGIELMYPIEQEASPAGNVTQVIDADAFFEEDAEEDAAAAVGV